MLAQHFCPLSSCRICHISFRYWGTTSASGHSRARKKHFSKRKPWNRYRLGILWYKVSMCNYVVGSTVTISSNHRNYTCHQTLYLVYQKFKSDKTSMTIIRKIQILNEYNCTLFKKSNFCPKFQFWPNPNIFTSFSPKKFLTIFLVKSKLSTAKKSKTTTFSRVFHPKKINNFLGKSKLNFWTKNEDFE